MNKLLKIFLLSVFAAVSGCNTITPVNIEQQQVRESVRNIAPPVEKSFGLELLIEQKLSNGEIIPIGSKAVQNVAVDEFDYPVNKLIRNQLQIEIDEITAGKHKLNLALYSLAEPFSVPLIIPNLDIQKVFVLLRISYNTDTKVLEKVEYGYDLDRNGVIDTDNNRFEMLGTENFYLITPTGQRRSISIDTTIDKNAVPEDLTLPPGVVPPANTSNQSDVKTPQEQAGGEIPKPLSTQTEVYPLPPGVQRPEQTPELPESAPGTEQPLPQPNGEPPQLPNFP